MIADIQEILVDEKALEKRVAELGEKITADYRGKYPILIGILKGSSVFMADLIRKIPIPVEIDFLKASSYGAEARSSGVVELEADLSMNLKGRSILLVEDIIDSGRTLASLMDRLRSRGPRGLAVCALLDKRIAPPLPELRFGGFTAPPAFLVGYGLDHAEDFRHLPYTAEMG